MKKSLFIAVAVLLVLTTGAFAGGRSEAAPTVSNATATATKYYVAHQGSYIGEATVTIDANNNVVAATFAEYHGPDGWVVDAGDGAVVRVPDPLANVNHPDPAIRGYMFYIYNEVGENGAYLWSQYTPGANGFARPARHWQRDFDGMMSNPIRAKAYADAVKNDTLVTVTIDGLNVTVGPTAGRTVGYGGVMDKANPASTYMPLRATSLGYRYNHAATVEFFKNNPLADYASARQERFEDIVVPGDSSIDANADRSAYAGAGNEWLVADARTGATYSDFPHYIIEMQEAYKLAVARMALGLVD